MLCLASSICRFNTRRDGCLLFHLANASKKFSSETGYDSTLGEESFLSTPEVSFCSLTALHPTIKWPGPIINPGSLIELLPNCGSTLFCAETEKQKSTKQERKGSCKQSFIMVIHSISYYRSSKLRQGICSQSTIFTDGQLRFDNFCATGPTTLSRWLHASGRWQDW